MTFAKVVSLCRCVAAFGVVVAACGVLSPPFPPLFLTFRPLEMSSASLHFHHTFACMPVCRQAQGQADWQAGLQGGLPGSRQACRPFRLQRKMTFAMVVSLCRCVAAFGVVVAACGVLCQTLLLLFLSLGWHQLFGFVTIPMPVCLRAGRHKGKQAGRPVNRQAGMNACRFANLKAYRQAAMLFPFAWQHLALSWQLVAFLTRISALENALPLHPSGRAKPKARTAGPGSVLLLGSRKVSGDRCLAGSVTAGIIPIRRVRIFVSSKTQQGVL